MISSDELREFVSKDVAQTSNDLQHPTGITFVKSLDLKN
jgi:hypothetical protein